MFPTIHFLCLKLGSNEDLMNKNKLSLLIYSTTTRIVVDFVGKLMVAELYALVLFPFSNFRILFKENKELKLIVNILSALLLVQIVSDIYNDSSSVDFLRGWALISFSIISTIYLVNQLKNNETNVLYFLFGIFLVNLFFGNGELDLMLTEEDTNYFKVRFVVFLDPAILIICYYLFSIKYYRFTCLFLLLSGLIYLSFDARSAGVVYIISSIVLYVKITKIRLTKVKIFYTIVLASFFLYLGYFFYVSQVLNYGFGGNNALNQLSKAKNPYNPFELLFFGRTEIIVLLQAGLDKPIFGHGSWGKDPNGYYAQLTSKLMDELHIYDTGYIRAHSILFGYWAYSGIVGLVLIIFLFFKLFSYSAKVYLSRFQFNTLPILVVLSVNMVWHLFFSPIGYLRTGFPLFASLMIVEYFRFKNVSKGYE